MTSNSPEKPSAKSNPALDAGIHVSAVDPLQEPTAIPQTILAQLAAQGGLPYPHGGMISPVGILQQVQFWQGQYPPPEAIERYEKLLPGVFGQMVEMTKQLQRAQIEGNERAQTYLQADTKRGHYLGFAVSMSALAGAIVLTFFGHSAVGIVCLSVPVMAVAVAFINSTKKQLPFDLSVPTKKQAASSPETPDPQT